MEVIFTTSADEDKYFWEKNDKSIIKKIDKLIADIQLHPYTGNGKPEPLKFHYTGYWSRRINQEHRLVYKVVGNTVYIAQCRFHY